MSWIPDETKRRWSALSSEEKMDVSFLFIGVLLMWAAITIYLGWAGFVGGLGGLFLLGGLTGTRK